MMLITSCAAGFSAVAAQDTQAEPAVVGARAVPIETRLNYPRAERDRKREGWVDVSFVITKEGTVVDPVIESSIGNRLFESATLRGVKKWRFEPATWNGEAVEQCETQYRVYFSMGGSIRRPTKKFLTHYESARQLLVNGKLAEAEGELEKLKTAAIYNLFQSSRYWYLKAMLAREKGDLGSAVDAFRRVGLWRDYETESGLDVRMYRAFFWTLVEYKDLGDALRQYTEMRQIDGAVSKEIESAVQGIVELEKSAMPFKVTRIIADNMSEDGVATIRYRPLRREVGITVGKGSLENLEIRCERNRIATKTINGQTWKTPANWGECHLYVTGDVGTEFSVVEIPSAPNVPENWL